MALNLNAEAVAVTTSGGFYKVDGDVTATTIMAAADHLGYTSTDGYTITMESEPLVVNAFENGDEVKTKRTGGKISCESTIIQSSALMDSLYYAGRVREDGGIEIDPNVTIKGDFVLDLAEEDEGVTQIVKRYWFKDAEVTATAPQTVRNGEALGYGITITSKRKNVVVWSAVTADLEAIPAA